MATLAFFFALTGASMAGVKYIATSDTIPGTSDLAGSTYGNPLIAAGKVTTGKIADGAITSAKFDSAATAPNADKLDGTDSTGFPRIVASKTATVEAGTFIEPNTCEQKVVLNNLPAGVDPSTDFVIVQPELSTNGSNAVVRGWFIRLADPPDTPGMSLLWCNPFLTTVTSAVPTTT